METQIRTSKIPNGVAPIRLETGRYEGLPVEERVCPLCGVETENEQHVLLNCVYYNHIRNELFDTINANATLIFLKCCLVKSYQ